MSKDKAQKIEPFGKYLLLDKIATGGMAEVYLAKAPGAVGISKYVAIKRILPQFSDSPEFIQMFKDEAKIVVNLNHSNIVSIYEFGVESNQFYLVMDYVDGQNLRQIYNKVKDENKRLPIDQAVFIVREVAKGLDHAHRCVDGSTGKLLNITHRDISPQNIMISFDGEVKIVDFGIAKAESRIETTRTGTLKGKFGYMSPEQVEDDGVDLRTDVFSLGIVAWELLANDRLFVANNELNALRKIRECQVPPLRKIDPNISPELEKIVIKALTRDRNLRYQTAAAFERDLSRFLNRNYPDFSSQDLASQVRLLFQDIMIRNRRKFVEYAQAAVQPSLELRSQPVVTEPFSGEPGFEPPPEDSVSNLSEDPNKITKLELEKRRAESERKKAELEKKRIEAERKKAELDASKLPQAASAKSPSSEEEVAIQLVNPRDDFEFTHSKVKKGIRRGYSLAYDEEGPHSRRMWMSFTATCLLLAAFTFWFYRTYPRQWKQVVLNVKYDQYDRALGIIKDTLLGRQKDEENLDPVDEAEKSVESTSVASLGSALNEPKVPLIYRPVVIMSQPSEAEIWQQVETSPGIFSYKSLEKKTPARIEVDATKAVRFLLKKDNFLDYEFGAEPSTSPFRMEATLQRAKAATVDIEAIPSDAKIFINGVQLKERLPILNYAIPANSEVRIRAEDPFQQTFDEISVTLKENMRKKISLKPHRPMDRRLYKAPASLDGK